MDDQDQEQARDATGRLGLLGHGTYYLLLTLLTVRILLGGGGEEAGAEGAIATVAQQPFGQVLLVGLTLAFAAYALVRWSRVVLLDDLSDRLKNGARAVVWSGLTVLAANALLSGVRGGGSGGGGGGNSLTQAVLDAPGGRWLVALAGLVLVGVSLYQFRKATDGGLGSELQELGLEEHRLACNLGRAGYSGRGLAYGLVAVFVIHAALTHDPSSAARGLDGALREIQRSSYGTWVLLAVAVGFAVFGVFRLVEARYTRDAS